MNLAWETEEELGSNMSMSSVQQYATQSLHKSYP